MATGDILPRDSQRRPTWGVQHSSIQEGGRRTRVNRVNQGVRGESEHSVFVSQVWCPCGVGENGDFWIEYAWLLVYVNRLQ